jgi:hypothetical protein
MSQAKRNRFIDEMKRFVALNTCDIFFSRSTKMAFNPAIRSGFHAVYWPDTVNHCPGCGHTNWYVGRFSAECGFCATALPLVETGLMGTGSHRKSCRPYERYNWAA